MSGSSATVRGDEIGRFFTFGLMEVSGEKFASVYGDVVGGMLLVINNELKSINNFAPLIIEVVRNCFFPFNI